MAAILDSEGGVIPKKRRGQVGVLNVSEAGKIVIASSRGTREGIIGKRENLVLTLLPAPQPQPTALGARSLKA